MYKLDKNGMDENEKALYSIADELIKANRYDIAALILASLIGYRLELVATLMLVAIDPIIDATNYVLDDMKK